MPYVSENVTAEKTMLVVSVVFKIEPCVKPMDFEETGLW
jgi:hypothetical protein